MSERKGKFIVFEGIDGAGKTTQIELLRCRLEKEGRSICCTAEPTDSDTGRMLRAALGGQDRRTACEMAALFTLDRIYHNVHPERGIRALLESGTDVICDRYYYSSLAYQGSLTDAAWVREMNLNCPEILRPDLCIFLDLTPEESLARIHCGRESTEIYENYETLQAVRNCFLEVLTSLRGRDNIAIVNAARGIDEIHEDILRIVTKELEA